MTYWKKYKHNKFVLTGAIKNPTVLGFSAYFHDSSAAIVKNGKILTAVEEERFSRQKHDSGFPRQAIKYCLDRAATNQIDAVVYYEDPDVKWDRIKQMLRDNPPATKTRSIIANQWKKIKSKSAIQKTFQQVTGIEADILFLDHHLSHAASSYLVSGFDESAIVTIDAVGEKNSTAWGYGKGNKIDLKECIEFPDSIGLMYTALTTFLGFNANDDEYKVMGLAAFGNQNKTSNKYYSLIRQLIDQKPDGSFRLTMKYFGHNSFESLAYTEGMSKLFGIEPRQIDQPINKVHKDIAAALQTVTEEVVLGILNYVQVQTGSDNLCLAGGVALNSAINGKILSSTPFKHLFIQPAAGDAGSAIGAAKYIQYQLDTTALSEHIRHSYYGPTFGDAEIKQILNKQKVIYSKFKSNTELLAETAKLLADNKVVGWFQGAMEWGPRALGHRSILASPLYSDMKNILNAKVKHRETFRPFAPVICEEDVFDYFDIDNPLPEPVDYMLMVYKVKKDKQHQLPAITHVDGTARPQVVRKEQNSLLYYLLKEFGAITGVPVLINTSFNVRGEPIVCTPQDAYRCMINTEIDYTILGKYIVERAKNLRPKLRGRHD